MNDDATTFAAGPVRSPTPAVGPAIAFLLGVSGHNHFSLWPGWPIPITAAVAVMAILLKQFRWPNQILTLISVLFLGLTFADAAHFQYRSDDIGLFVDDQPALVRMRLKITAEPRLVSADPSDPHPLPPRMSAEAEARSIMTDHGWVPATGRVPVTLKEPDPSLTAGQVVEVLGQLERPRPAANPGEFDWADYYRTRRVLTTLTIPRAANVTLLSDDGRPIVEWLSLKARHLLAAGFTSAHSLDEAVLQSLVLGDRDRRARPMRDRMESLGVGYQLNVSGLHLTVIAILFAGLCRLMRLPPRRTLVIAAAVIIAYGLVSTPGHSGARSVLLATAFAYAVLSGRSSAKMQALSLAAVVMLLISPLELFEAGFQLSFLVVAAFSLAIPKPRRPGPLDPIRKNTLWRRFVAHVRRAAAFAVVAWLASLPIVVYRFGAVSPWAAVLGLLLLPVVVAALVSGVLKIIATLLWPAGASVWATIAGGPVEVLRWSVDQMAKLPGGSVPVAAPPAWVVVGCYALMAVPLVPWEWFVTVFRRVLPLAVSRWFSRSSAKPQAATPSRITSLVSDGRWRFLGPIVAVLILVVPHPSAVDKPPGDLRLTLLSLGAGQCAIAELPGGSAAVFDIGSTNVPDVDARIVEPFLQAHRITSVDDLFLSHGDYDHISGAVELLDRYSVPIVSISHQFRDHAAGNDPDLRLLDVLDHRNHSTLLTAVGGHADFGRGVSVDVLWPPAAGAFSSNDAGLVLMLKYAGVSVLLPADIQDPAFAGLLKHPEQLKADVLIAPHHGSSESLTAAFLAAVKPKLIVSSNADRLTQKQKRFDRLAGAIPVLRTSAVGSITVTVHADGTWDVATFKASNHR